MVGLVSSNPMVTLFQVASRVMVVCGVLIGVEGASESQGIHFLLFAWTITEIIRYSFYAFGIFGINVYPLVWCRYNICCAKMNAEKLKNYFIRYTLFIALYPIGVTGELLCLYAASQIVAESKQWTYTMPNVWNFTFNYQYFLLIVMSLYVPCKYSLFFYDRNYWHGGIFIYIVPLLRGNLHVHVSVFPQMYLHMFGQRKKVIGGAGSKKKN